MRLGVVILLVFACVFANAANRVVSLAPNITEMLYAAGAGKQLVGVSSFSDYPKAATHLPIVANASEINLEKIISLKANWVFVLPENAHAAAMSILRHEGVHIVLVKVKHLNDIPKTMIQMGKLLGTEKIAKHAAKRWRQRLKQLHTSTKHLRVFYQLSAKPLLTLGKSSLINEVISRCGGVNVYDQTKGAAPEVDVESVIAQKPDVILISQFAGDQVDVKEAWRRWTMIPAVLHNRLETIPSSLIDRPGPRILIGATQICRALNQAD
jgi:iron complex transport system substrate-binding protein